MKKILLLFLVSSVLILSACNKEEHNVLVCKNKENKYVLNINENNNVDSIYYENIFDFNAYYTEEEILEFNSNQQMLAKIIEKEIYDCNNTSYACESTYKNSKIENKIYVTSKKEATSSNLDKYYGINSTDARTLIVQNENVTCDIKPYTDKYQFDNHKTTIVIDNTYSSIDELYNELNRPKYLKEYNLVEIENKKATIEFKEDNKCIIDLSEFNQETWNGSYCDNNKNKDMNYITYNSGNCTYTIKNDYIFYINYDGTYTSGKYCGTKDNNKYKQDSNVINKEIVIEFDTDYNSFEYQNGVWVKHSQLSPLTYR